MKLSAVLATLLFTVSFSACKQRTFSNGDGDIMRSMTVGEEGRRQAIADADAWGDPWDGTGSADAVFAKDQDRIRSISSKDLFRGPEDDFFNAPNSPSNLQGGAIPISCDFDDRIDPNDPPGGRTAKFGCVYNGKSVKIKYDPAISVQGPTGCKVPLTPNFGLYGEIVATRIMWALGFRVDKMYPVRATCRNCPIDPWGYIRRKANIRDFKDDAIKQICPDGQFAPGMGPMTRHQAPFEYFPAATEAKIRGASIVTDLKEGWSFTEIFGNDAYSNYPSKKRRQVIQREALAVFMAFLSHADSKEDNQRLVCLDKNNGSARGCNNPFLMVHDPGNVMGRGWAPMQNMREGMNASTTFKIDLNRWLANPTWKRGDSSTCTVHVNKHVNGTLQDLTVSAAGVNFLRSLVTQLTRKQVVDAFNAALIHFAPPGAAGQAAPDAERWANAFLAKIKSDIIDHRCMK